MRQFFLVPLFILMFLFATCGGQNNTNTEKNNSNDATEGKDSITQETVATQDQTPDTKRPDSPAEQTTPDVRDAGPKDAGPKDTGPQDVAPPEQGPKDSAGPDKTPTDPTPTVDNPDKCYAFSLDENSPLAIDGTFDKNSKMWRRPHDDPPVCPATALTPANKSLVPYVAYTFCNTDSKPHKFMFEMLSQKGPKGEKALDDPYLFLYTGKAFPSDLKQCLAVNDDVPDALNTSDSEITGITVPAGGAITVVGTTVTFDPNDGTGSGYYVLVVSIDTQ